uniref:RING-CH-type domain-containing protein n=1 Tax=Hyaloperonospora arabidopsidis (strain Emoy2) TaxID=559515 RepID=M4BEP9_HYAAE
MLRAKHMGFKSVRRVEVKAETTTPGDVRPSIDATGARGSAPRGRRTLPKLEFIVDEEGAVLHGPQQRGSYPFLAPSSASVANAMNLETLDAALERDLAASFQALHMRDFMSLARRQDDMDQSQHVYQQPHFDQPQSSDQKDSENKDQDNNNDHGEEGQQENREDARGGGTAASTAAAAAAAVPPPVRAPMKECVLNDTRATTLALKYDNALGKFVCGSSIERFSGHTGVCRVLGSKKYPVIPHSLRLGDLLRIGSVGLVVCELNRTTRDETEEALTAEQYEFLKANFLSLPLQQTFHPTEPSPTMEVSGELDDDEKDQDDTMRVGGDTSDEGESEEDKDRKAQRCPSADGEDGGSMRHSNVPLGVAGISGKRFCYICYDGEDDVENNPLVAPCHCKGDTKYVHLDCLQRWNNNLDADGTNPNQKVCAVTNTDGLDVCSICKATYLTSVRLDDGRVVSLLVKKLPPPYVTFAVVTQHETRNRSTALTNTRFQLSFAKYVTI